MNGARFAHVIGVDDAPFERAARGRVLVVAVAFSGLRLEGVPSRCAWLTSWRAA